MSRRARRLLGTVIGSMMVLVILGWDQGQMVTGWGLPERSSPPMLIVAHRGNTDGFPEDTAEAVWDAARLGADGIEFDVHQSADGTWWLTHDPTVDRTTDGTGSVRGMADSELEHLRLTGGRGFDPARHGDVGLSRLDSVLEGLRSYRGELYVDLQHAVDADPRDLAVHLAGSRSTVICRSLEDARAIKEVDPSLGTLIRANRIDGEDGVDAVFLEAVGEATVGRVALYRAPVATYMDDRHPHLGQDVILRRAWSAGVSVFLARDLVPAMELRDVLEATRRATP